MRGGLPGAESPTVEDTFRVEFSCVAAGVEAGEVCYGLDVGDVRGLFEYGMEDGFERRVLHGPKHWFELVPKNWELVQRRPDGTTQTIASNVMAYAIGRQGNLNFSNGKGVFALASPVAKP